MKEFGGSEIQIDVGMQANLLTNFFVRLVGGFS
jgi:hypothetical protein